MTYKAKANILVSLSTRKTVSMSAWLENSSTNRPGLIQSMLMNVWGRKRHAVRKGESKMVIWSEVRNETCHNELEPRCLNYSGLFLKERSGRPGKEEVGSERIVSEKRDERQTEGEMGGRRTPLVPYSGSRTDKDMKNIGKERITVQVCKRQNRGRKDIVFSGTNNVTHVPAEEWWWWWWDETLDLFRLRAKFGASFTELLETGPCLYVCVQ